MNDDRDLQQHYLNERSDSTKAPEFDQMWNRAVLESTPPGPRKFARTAIPAYIATAVAILAISTALILGNAISPTTTAHHHPDAIATFILDLEQEQALAIMEWETPTDFLLNTDEDWFYQP